MPIIATDVLMGPVELFTAPFGTTEPANATVAPAAAWIAAGGTQEGLRQIINQTYTPKVVDELGMPVGAKLTELSVQMATALAEARLANFRLALNQAAAATTKLELNGVLTNGEPGYVSVLARGFGPNGLRRNVIIRKALSSESVESTYSKANQTFVPITWSGYFVSESIAAFLIDDTQGA